MIRHIHTTESRTVLRTISGASGHPRYHGEEAAVAHVGMIAAMMLVGTGAAWDARVCARLGCVSR